jgi:hypothetical protein
MLHRCLGEFLVEEGFVTEEQLRRGLMRQERIRSMKVGEILVEMGVLGHGDLMRAVQRHLSSVARGGVRQRLTDWLIEERLITPVQIQIALWRQEQYRQRRIGEILVELGLLSQARLDTAIRMQLESIAAA